MLTALDAELHSCQSEVAALAGGNARFDRQSLIVGKLCAHNAAEGVVPVVLVYSRVSPTMAQWVRADGTVLTRSTRHMSMEQGGQR